METQSHTPVSSEYTRRNEAAIAAGFESYSDEAQQVAGLSAQELLAEVLHMREYKAIRSQVEAGIHADNIVEQYPPISQMRIRSIVEACELDVRSYCPVHDLFDCWMAH